MTTDALRLVLPDRCLCNAFIEMAHDYSAAGEPRYELALRDFDAYLNKVRDKAAPHERAGLVPMREFWLEQRGRLNAVLRLRLWLTAALEQKGGHIGYDVRPSERGRGYGTVLLELGLIEARKCGIAQVLITCDIDNYASARVIEKNGGQRATDSLDEDGATIRRYWIDT
jgi:predicted acetyltransferase